MSLPRLNAPAPDFTLLDQDGKSHTLSYHRESWVLLYFYPKDDTPGCTKEACSMRDSLPDFGTLKAKVFGVSVDTVASHKKFADKYQLPFTLLADPEKEVVKLYGVAGPLMARRTSFLIDPGGVVKKIYEDVNPVTHAKDVLADLARLTG